MSANYMYFIVILRAVDVKIVVLVKVNYSAYTHSHGVGYRNVLNDIKHGLYRSYDIVSIKIYFKHAGDYDVGWSE